MSTDIHMIAEVFHDGKWERVTKPVFTNCWYSLSNEEELYTDCPFDTRNYEVFDVLQNEGGHVGLPDDLSEGGHDFFDSTHEWGFGYMWWTLEELQQYSWSSTEDGIVWMIPPQYHQYKENNILPRYLITNINIIDDDIVIIDEDEDIPENCDLVCCHVEYEDKTPDVFAWWRNETMRTLATLGEPDKVRIVFCFDC